MSATRSRRRSRSRPQDVLQKPRGVIHPRVQKVGPEHFGIVSLDSAKKRSKWMLTDFFGNILIAPTLVEHNRPGFDAAITQLRAAIKQHDLRDLIVALERSGRYPHPPKRAFAAAGFEVRIVHPFTTKQFRLPVLRDLQAAVEQLPHAAHAAEAVPLVEELDKIAAGHRHGPQPLADILPIVLARLGVTPVESKKSGEKDLR